MIRYIAFLRAVNVGGRMVKMEALRALLVMPGFKNIATYIQSGNIAFDCAETQPAIIINKIEKKLQSALGFEVKTLLKTVPELQQIIDNNPFKGHPEDMALHVSFLSGKPDGEVVKQLLPLQNDMEKISFADTVAYILVKKGTYGETKFSNTFLEKKLKLHATTRNWATVNKMITL
jgi:uncharacterized protein (DUF1697 family)